MILTKSDRALTVAVGGDAVMTLPRGDWLWQLRYQRQEPPRGALCDDRMLAAGVLESYLYLIQMCNRDEAWRRIKILREALDETGGT